MSARVPSDFWAAAAPHSAEWDPKCEDSDSPFSLGAQRCIGFDARCGGEREIAAEHNVSHRCQPPQPLDGSVACDPAKS